MGKPLHFITKSLLLLSLLLPDFPKVRPVGVKLLPARDYNFRDSKIMCPSSEWRVANSNSVIPEDIPEDIPEILYISFCTLSLYMHTVLPSYHVLQYGENSVCV